MNKIPVGETISGAYDFAFAHFLSVIGVFWLPYLVFAAIIAALIHFITPDLPHQLMQGPWDFTLMESYRRISGLISLIGLVVTSIVTVGLQRQALGLHTGPVFYFFSLGAPVWRMIGAFLIAIIVVIVVAIVTIGLCVAIWFGASSIGSPVAVGLVRAVAIIAGLCWLVYFEVRLLFFLPAVVVAEDSLGLGRAWTLGGGNFWRIIAVWIVVYLPVAIGLCMVLGAVMGPFMPPLTLLTAHQPPNAQGFHDFIQALMKNLHVIGPIYLVFAVISRLIFAALGNGAIATAYRHVVPAGAPGDHG